MRLQAPNRNIFRQMDGVRAPHNKIFGALVLVTLAVAIWLRLVDLPNVPFGWHPDEATKALLARDVLDGKYFPAFFSAFTGRDALYVYLEAAMFGLLGERIFVARLLSAFIGILTIALTFAIGRRLFNRRVGLFATIFLAGSLWHLIASRNGYRAVIQPLIQLPVILALLQGWRQKGNRALRSFIFAGFWLGLTQYTYTAARFFPPLIAAVVVLRALLSKRDIGWRWREYLVMVVVAIMVILPLGIHFARNPGDIVGRAAQVSVFSPEWSGGQPLARLWQSVKETGRMFTVWGDINYRFNIAGQPVFGLADGALFYLGVLLCLWYAGTRVGKEKLPYLLALLWVVIMLLPMTLSAESLPYYQRAIGVLPAVYFFPALALDGVLARMPIPRVAGRQGPVVPVLLVTSSLLLVLCARTYRDYFERWHLTPRNDDDRRVAMVYVADYLHDSGLPQPLYLSTQYLQHPTLALLAPDYYDQVTWFDGGLSLPLPVSGRQAMYIFLRENAPQQMLLEIASGLEQTATEFDRFGRPVFDSYQWTGGDLPAPVDVSPAVWSWQVAFGEQVDPSLRHLISLPVSFGQEMAFVGHNRRPQQLRAGDTMEVVLFWRILGRPQRAYTFFVHLLDEESKVIAAYDANGYPTTLWPETGGELLLSYFSLSIPADRPPGEYQFEIGVYEASSGERLMIKQDGKDVADRLLLEPVQLLPPE